MKKLAFLLVIMTALVVISCNKNQSAVKKLDGTWTLKKIDGSDVPDSLQYTTTFTKCKLRKEEWCDMSVTYDGTTTEYEFKVTDKGQTLVQQNAYGSIVTENSFTIKDITKTGLFLEWTDTSGTYSADYEKN